MQQAELYALTEVCSLAKGKTANIYTGSQYSFGATRDFGITWKQGFPTSNGEKIKNGSYMQNQLGAILLTAALTIIKIPGHSELESL